MTPADRGDERAAGGSTSRSLLAEARRADQAAWRRLAGLYAPLAAYWCRRWGVPDQDVVDVLQEIFGTVAARLDRFHHDRPGDTFRGWLLTISRNKVHDYFRRRGNEPGATGGTAAALRLQQVLDPRGERPAAEPGEGESLDVEAPAALGGVLRHALDSIHGEFHERTWRAFWGVAVEGRLTADVAADLAMSSGAVRVAKSRVLLRLRRELGDVPP